MYCSGRLVIQSLKYFNKLGRRDSASDIVYFDKSIIENKFHIYKNVILCMDKFIKTTHIFVKLLHRGIKKYFF